MENNQRSIKRRDFIKSGAGVFTATLLMGSGASKLFGNGSSLSSTSSVPNAALNNGIKMPMLGFGTNTLNDELGIQSVSDAISVGYRLIDTAHIYGNEAAVGEGIKQSGIEREKLFVTSKLWVDDSGFESTKKAFQTSIDKLGTNYLDLYLIHRPRGDVKGTWKAMEELYKDGKIKAIGVSNFNKAQLDEMMSYAKVKPAVNQIETHVFYQQDEAHQYLNGMNIQMEAWSPFAAGRNGIFSNETLAAIGKKHNKSIAQVCLRWHFQRGIVAIPRSSQKAHMIENLNIFDFELDEKDFQTIAKLDLNKTQFPEWE